MATQDSGNHELVRTSAAKVPAPAGDGPIELAFAHERLRQRQETFNQIKVQDARWFVMRLTMGWISVAVIVFITVACSYIILDAAQFPATAVTFASAGLLVDVLATMLAIWKLVLGKGPQPLAPLEGRIEEGPAAQVQ